MKDILNYLSALEAYNNREWYHAHKKEYRGVHSASVISKVPDEKEPIQ